MTSLTFASPCIIIWFK